MKTLKLTEVLDAISQYCENHQGKKPMMLWFHSNPDVDGVRRVINKTPSYATFIGHPLKLGNEYMILNDEVVKIADHKELLDEFIFPSTYKIEKTKYEAIEITIPKDFFFIILETNSEKHNENTISKYTNNKHIAPL